jgi:hypothetical protein
MERAYLLPVVTPDEPPPEVAAALREAHSKAARRVKDRDDKRKKAAERKQQQQQEESATRDFGLGRSLAMPTPKASKQSAEAEAAAEDAADAAARAAAKIRHDARRATGRAAQKLLAAAGAAAAIDPEAAAEAAEAAAEAAEEAAALKVPLVIKNRVRLELTVKRRARSRCRFVPPRIQFIPGSLTHSVLYSWSDNATEPQVKWRAWHQLPYDLQPCLVGSPNFRRVMRDDEQTLVLPAPGGAVHSYDILHYYDRSMTLL